MVRLARTIIVAIYIVALTGSAAAGTYTNDKYGFSFDYPDNYSIKLESENYFTVLDEDSDTILTVYVEDIKHYPRDMYLGYSDPFKEFATWRALLRCDADGPDGSAFCPALKSSKESRTQGGIRTLELLLMHVQETRGDSPKTEDSVTGPLYVADVSRRKHTVVLMLGTLPHEQMTEEQRKLAGSILDSIKLTK